MAESTSEKLVVFATHGEKDAEMATLPWVVANAALAMDVPTTMILQGEGVTLVQKGCYEHIAAAGFDPLEKLVQSFLEFGGSILVCIPCLQARTIQHEMLVEGTQLIKAARVVQEVMEAKSVVNY